MKNFKTYKSFKHNDYSFVTENYSDEERKELADKGFALSDGSFPIKDLKDLKNAIQAYGRAKDQARAAKFIVKRAKALGAEDLIPDTEDFQKSLGESKLTEAKDDYTARYKDTNINLKKGYKHLNDEELNQLYLEIGELISANKLKVKDATLQFESVGTEGYDVSGISREDLKHTLNYLDMEDISYDFDGKAEILDFDMTELDRKGQAELKKLGIKESVVNEAFKFSEKEVKDIAELIAKAIAKVDNMPTAVHDMEFDKGRGAGFEISIDGEKYDGGSYVVRPNGDVVNSAIGYSFPNAIYAKIGD